MAVYWHGSKWVPLLLGADDRPWPRVGDWVQVKGLNSTIVLKAYLSSPNCHIMCGPAPYLVNVPGQWHGPVLDMEQSLRFTSVLLPIPACEFGPNVWVNVWTTRDKAGLVKRGGQWFANVYREV